MVYIIDVCVCVCRWVSGWLGVGMWMGVCVCVRARARVCVCVCVMDTPCSLIHYIQILNLYWSVFPNNKNNENHLF